MLTSKFVFSFYLDGEALLAYFKTHAGSKIKAKEKRQITPGRGLAVWVEVAQIEYKRAGEYERACSLSVKFMPTQRGTPLDVVSCECLARRFRSGAADAANSERPGGSDVVANLFLLPISNSPRIPRRDQHSLSGNGRYDETQAGQVIPSDCSFLLCTDPSTLKRA